jgi:hypothetical protein
MGGGQMFEESKHEDDVSGKQGHYIEDDHMHDDLGNRDLFSTACTTPNLSSIDEAQSFITAALSLLPTPQSPQSYSVPDMHLTLTQASTVLSHLKLQLTAELRLFETRLLS